MYSISQNVLFCKNCGRQEFDNVKVSLGMPVSAVGSGIGISGDGAGDFIISICKNCSLCVFKKSDSWIINRS